jgi:putative membrane protein
MGTMSNGSSQSNDVISLQNLTGTAFDVQYMRMMLQDHQQAIGLFTSASQSSDAEVRAFAKKTLPALQAHFAHAKQVNRVAHQ